MKKTNIAFIGANGRMGMEFAAVAANVSSAELTLAIIHKTGKTNFKSTHTKISPKAFKGINIIVDFSTPKMTKEVLSFAVTQKIPVLIGTTGHAKEFAGELEKASAVIPVMFASNMSIGIAEVKKLVGLLSKNKSFDVHIHELHHKHKKDKPSGTAVSLESAVNGKMETPTSSRIGGICGIHTVYFSNEHELIKIEHTAFSRKVFAEGALKAALWLAKKKKGLYFFEDIVK